MPKVKLSPAGRGSTWYRHSRHLANQPSELVENIESRPRTLARPVACNNRHTRSETAIRITSVMNYDKTEIPTTYDKARALVPKPFGSRRTCSRFISIKPKMSLINRSWLRHSRFPNYWPRISAFR